MNKVRSLLVFILISVSFCSAAPLKILFVVGYFPHLTQKFVLDPMVAFMDRGHQIAIHSFYEPKHEKVHPEVHEYNLLARTSYGDQMPRFDSFDIVYVQFGIYAERVIQEAETQQYRGKIVVCFRGYDISGYLRLYPNAYREVFQKADLFLPVCNLFKERLIKLGCDPEKIVVSRSGICLDKIPETGPGKSSRRAFNIITVARLIEKKGLQYGLEAVARLKKEFPHIRYYIVGDADVGSNEQERLQNLAKKLGIDDRVTFCGWATHERVKALISQSNLMILPSITGKNGDEEGIPNALKEAMASGLPVISTQSAGAELIEHGVSGFLVPEKDSLSLSHKIAHFIRKPEMQVQFGKNGRAFVEKNFDIKKIVARLESIFINLCKQKK
jgi:colanic acid/amylovoran biosynthesis glycosyltransferase